LGLVAAIYLITESLDLMLTRLLHTMMRRLLFILIMCFLIHGFPVQADHARSAAQKIKVGVLAYRGEEKARIKWQPTIDYLSQKIESHEFELVPLNLQQMKSYVAERHVDFVITNTGNFVTLAHQYGISRLATVIVKRLLQTTMRYGATIFTHIDRTDINRLSDLKGKSFMGVNKNGFGGFQMAWLEFKEQNINPLKDFSRLEFSGFPQSRVVAAVINKEVDAGTFRTDSLESLAVAGKIDLSKIKILNQQYNPKFPFLHSTKLYPEWPFAKLKHTSEGLAREVTLALLSMKESGKIADDAQIEGWTIPLNYKPANDLMKSLNVGPYKNLGEVTLVRVVKKYWPWLLASLILFIVMAILSFFIYSLNSKLRLSNQLLENEVNNRTKLAKKLQYKATHDSLTQAYNRRAFKSFLEREIQRSLRYKNRFAIFLIDVDNFKEINDRFGHHIGDEFLRQFSKRLHNTLQKTDIFARIGGDEFAIMCFDVDEENLDHIKERLISVSDNPYHFDDIKFSATFSLGTAIFPLDGKNIKELYVHADRNMYLQKHGDTSF